MSYSGGERTGNLDIPNRLLRHPVSDEASLDGTSYCEAGEVCALRFDV